MEINCYICNKEIQDYMYYRNDCRKCKKNMCYICSSGPCDDCEDCFCKKCIIHWDFNCRKCKRKFFCNFCNKYKGLQCMLCGSDFWD